MFLNYQYETIISLHSNQMVNNGTTSSASTLVLHIVIPGQPSNTENTSDTTGMTQHTSEIEDSEPTFAREAVK